MTQQPSATYKFRGLVPKKVRLQGRDLDRDDFYAWLWSHFTDEGLLGVHEGTLLSEDAAEQGFETDSWTVDSGEAPRERDWIASANVEQAEFYFDSRANASNARDRLMEFTGIEFSGVEEQKAEDWDAQWKASFSGAVVKPFWQVLPPWRADSVELRESILKSGEKIIQVNPGAGFGTGTHETTQLCLQAVGETAIRWGGTLSGKRVLDFGSGSGILAIGAALLGAQVDAVEIDPLAIDNSIENAKLNSVTDRVRYTRTLEESIPIPIHDGPYDIVIANILKPVLLEFAPQLVRRMRPSGVLILSGLIEGDVAPVSSCFGGLLSAQPKVSALNEWRSLVWNK